MKNGECISRKWYKEGKNEMKKRRAEKHCEIMCTGRIERVKDISQKQERESERERDYVIVLLPA